MSLDPRAVSIVVYGLICHKNEKLIRLSGDVWKSNSTVVAFSVYLLFVGVSRLRWDHFSNSYVAR